jgi:hypothetical protein
MSGNRAGGFDSDGADYSSQGQFRAYAVSTCPNNLFSFYGDESPLPIDDALKKRLEGALKEEAARLSSTSEPPVWERYGIAARMYREMGRDGFFLGHLYLEAAWTARDEGVGVTQALQGPEQTRALLEAGRKELERPITAAQKKTVAYNLARIAHRGGYSAERDQMLRYFEGQGQPTAAESAAVARLRAQARVEGRYLELALVEFKAAIANPSAHPADRARATYLAADLERRLGRPAAAHARYAEAMAYAELSPDLRSMAQFLDAELLRLHPELSPR